MAELGAGGVLGLAVPPPLVTVEPASPLCGCALTLSFLLTGGGGASRWRTAVGLRRGVCFSRRRAVLPLQGSLGPASGHQDLGASQVRCGTRSPSSRLALLSLRAEC